jgi:hypothetical protein
MSAFETSGRLDSATLRRRVGDLGQVAAVRPIVLDDGQERGVRALAFSTGGGLDFWVLVDRSLDIGPAWWRGMPFAWQSPNGFRHPGLIDAAAEEGRGFERGFSGLLVTCGLEHIRQPADGHPLHGRLPYTPARLTGHGTDWERDEPVLFCEGEVTQASLNGERLRLCRRIEAPVGGTELRILDRVENLAGVEQPLAILYHFNLGFPAVQAGTEVRLNDHPLWGPLPQEESAPVPAACEPAGGDVAECRVISPLPAGQSFQLSLAFSTDTLPYLQLWRDLRPATGILAIEPCNRPKTGGAGPTLAPFGSSQVRLTMRLGGHHAPAGSPC